MLVIAAGIQRQRGQESGLCLPFLGWMTQQLSFSRWGRIGDRDSQIALPPVGVWIYIWITVRPLREVGVVWIYG